MSDKNLNMTNLTKTSSELNVVHYIEDLYNKTHQEFNTMANSMDKNNTNSIPVDYIPGVTADTLRQTYGISPDQKLRFQTPNDTTIAETNNNPTNQTNHNINHNTIHNSLTYNKNVMRNTNDINAKSINKLPIIWEKHHKSGYSPKVLDMNFTGMEWKPIVPKLHVKGFADSLLKPKIADIMDAPIITKSSQEFANLLNTKSISPNNPDMNGADYSLMMASGGQPLHSYEQLMDSPHNMRVLPSNVYEQQVLSPQVKPEGLVYNINPFPTKPVVHRIKDFLRNILFPKQ